MVFFVPQLQAPISGAIFGLIQIITIPLGVAAVVEPVLRSALAG